MLLRVFIYDVNKHFCTQHVLVSSFLMHNVTLKYFLGHTLSLQSTSVLSSEVHAIVITDFEICTLITKSPNQQNLVQARLEYFSKIDVDIA